jgi:UDP-N-acetylmuramoylalanine--D-glutamate ligase
MKIAILGFASQGQAAYEYWNNGDNELTICDSREGDAITIPTGADAVLGPKYLEGLDRFDLIVRGAPSIHPREIMAANDELVLEKVTSATNEFFRVCPTKNIIGVTGTKGKGTTSTLIARILEAAGKTVHLGGNIGTPPLDLLKNNIQADDWVVLELANYQLIDVKYSPHIATCLLVVPEHLDWHGTMEEYVAAKQQMFKWQKHDDKAIFNRANQHSKDIVAISMAEKSSYEVPGPGAEPTKTTGAYVKDDLIYMDTVAVCHAQDVGLRGRHNLQNVCAALATTWNLINQDAGLFKQVVSEFTGLPYRLELVREVNGVQYYDDSLGTTPETAIAAIQAFDAPKVMILGGASKGVEFDILAQSVASSNVRTVIAIGSTGGEITSALKTAGYENVINGAATMAEIVSQAAKAAEDGDVVLLSTACASFDMFKDYKDRSLQFKSAVRALPEAS